MSTMTLPRSRTGVGDELLGELGNVQDTHPRLG